MAEITKAELWRHLLELYQEGELESFLHKPCTLADVISLLIIIGVVQENEE